MRTITFTKFILVLIILITNSIAQEKSERFYRVRITLQPEQNIQDILNIAPVAPIEENTYEVKLTDRELNLLHSKKIKYRIVENLSPTHVTAPATNLNAGYAHPYILEMVNNVSIDSLATQILALQSFNTRYEYTPQQDSAGEYIYREFERWGLEVERDRYSFGTTTIYDLDFADKNTCWIVGTKGMIASTTDGGESWVMNPSNISSDLYGVDFIDNTTGWCVGANGKILKTTNGGGIWFEQSSGITSALYDVNFVNDTLGLIVGASGRILRTTNGGNNWLLISSGTTQGLRELQFVNPSYAWAVGTSATILHSTDGGATWNPQIAPPGVTTYLRAINFIDTQQGWIVGDGRVILKTTNGGINWIRKTAPAGVDSILRGVSFYNPLHGWVVDYNGRILSTTDGGESWVIQFTHLGWRAYLLNVKAFNESQILVVGVWGNLYRSTNRGTSWVKKTSSLPIQFRHDSYNIVATIPGTVTPEKECVIVAHYDSYSNNPWSLAPGANDNATGTSAVMEAARICRNYQFESTIRFLAVSGEELGMFGSDHYAFKARDERRNIIGVVNGDMIGYPTTSDSARLVVGSYATYNWLIDSSFIYNQRYNIGLTLVGIIDNTGASDYGPFALAGYDALDVAEATAEEIWGGADPYYHTIYDTYDKLTPSLIRRGTQLMLSVVAELARPIINTISVSFEVNNRWNLVSVPVELPNMARSEIFPNSTSDAFRYEEVYFATDTLKCGVGYWLKFPQAEKIILEGLPTLGKEIDVRPGWNLIGSQSEDVLVENITTDPPNILISPFFGYNNGYFITSQIKVGKGYWIKVKAAGKIIF